MKTKVNILWFKKNLRIIDNEIFEKINQNFDTIAFYCFEPSIINEWDFSDIHKQFIFESLIELWQNLKKLNIKLIIFQEEVIKSLKDFLYFFDVINLISTQETWNYKTFLRDIEVNNFCKNNNINFIEVENNWVIRKLKSRDDWTKIWNNRMNKDIFNIVNSKKIIEIDYLENIKNNSILGIKNSLKYNSYIQKWWENIAIKTLDDFLENRVLSYSYDIWKPLKSTISCSRLSPYISNWNISIKYIYKKSLEKILFLKEINDEKSKAHIKQINFFLSRIHWQSHFIQKFEDDYTIEFKNLNPYYNDIRTKENSEIIEKFFLWKTWIPIIDANIICLKNTWRTNFRSRAMLVSFICNTMMQPWQSIAKPLASIFLDYEPWIHYSQIQMQSWTTWINTIRIYNPIKQSLEKDPEWLFIKKWLPKLKNISWKDIHFPFENSKSIYIEPIIKDIEKQNKLSSEILRWVRKNLWFNKIKKETVKKHASRKTIKAKKTKEKINNQLLIF